MWLNTIRHKSDMGRRVACKCAFRAKSSVFPCNILVKSYNFGLVHIQCPKPASFTLSEILKAVLKKQLSESIVGKEAMYLREIGACLPFVYVNCQSRRYIRDIRTTLLYFIC